MIRGKLNICVVDNIGGAYLPAALALSRFFGRTYYYAVTQNPFPRLANEVPGLGYDEIIVINEFWNRLDEFDIVIFTDIYFSDWGKALRKMGKMVWGGTDAEELENDRKLFKQELKNAVLPVAPTSFIKGVKNLKEFLRDKEDKWIKISYYRGEAETFHHIDFKHSELQLDQMIYTLGPLESELEFLVEDPIISVCEAGYDGWTINGEFSDNSICGFEIKNKAYVGKRTTYDELPKPVKYVNERFKDILKKYNHTGFYSTEIRCTENETYYFTDPCVRLGSPPSNTYLDMISNWDEIIFGGCNGKVIEPEFVADYGVEIILKSNWVNDNYLPITFPEEYKDNIKLKGSFIKDEQYYIIPFKWTGFEMSEIGSVVVVGDDLELCMERAMEIAGKVEGYDVYYDENALEKARETIENANEKLNMKF